jgi:4-hydroxythreonine-4-phosphate dehydrogenase
MKPRIAITVGDYNGIGPEVAVKAIHDSEIRQICRPMLVGPADVFGRAAEACRIAHQLVNVGPFNGDVFRKLGAIPDDDCTYVVTSDEFPRKTAIAPGTISVRAGRVAGTALMVAVEMAVLNLIDAVVTAPVSKKALHMAGFRFPGQTEMLQRLTHSANVAMILVSDTMRVGLVTIHLPIRQVARVLTGKLLRNKIETIHRALATDWRIAAPRLAVLGLNPHAGETGEIGIEEKTVIGPVVRRLRARGMDVHGPFAADGFFGRYTPGTFDAVIAMYHDQGLIPLKMSSFGTAVNVSAGLPIVRTSPDHGTAFDIAGRGIADSRSMIEAIRCAARIAANRMTTHAPVAS